MFRIRIRIHMIRMLRTGTGPVLRTNVSRATGPSAAGISSGAWARRRRGTVSPCRAASPTTSSWPHTCKYFPDSHRLNCNLLLEFGKENVPRNLNLYRKPAETIASPHFKKDDKICHSSHTPRPPKALVIR